MDNNDDAEEDSSAVAEDSDVKDSVEGAKEEDGKEEEEERMEVWMEVWRSKRKKSGGRGAKEEIEMKVEEEDEMAEVKEEEDEDKEEKGGGVSVITMKGYCARLVRTNKYNKLKKVKEDKEKDQDDALTTTTPVSSAPDLVTINSMDETQEDYNDNDDDDNKNDNDNDDDNNNQAPQVEVINGQVTIAEDSLLANPTSRTSTALIDAGFSDTVVNNDDSLGIVRARHGLF
jgi:hypothetical protein